MRKGAILGILLSLAGARSAHADSVQLSWNAVAGATSYVIYSSVDQGANWVKIVDTAQTSANYDAPNDRLILFRVSAKNSAGESVAYTKGMWFNGAWSPLPRSLTIQ